MLQKRLKNDEEEVEDDEKGKQRTKVVKPGKNWHILLVCWLSSFYWCYIIISLLSNYFGKLCIELKISEMDEWEDSDDDSVNSEDEQEKEKKKKGMIYDI